MRYWASPLVIASLLTASASICAEDDSGLDPAANESVSAQPGARKLTKVERRILAEREQLDSQYTLLPHKPNYVLLYAYNEEPNLENWIGYSGEPDQEELIIQFSFKFPLWVSEKAVAHRMSAFVAYTQKAFWQAYNQSDSRPFRESNHEPELLINYLPQWQFGDWLLPVITLGINHQSNGQSGVLSRSWNRAYLDFVFAKNNYAISIKPWYRFQESEASDDNPDIEDFLGHGEITFAYGHDNFNVSLMLRNNFKSEGENAGAGQLDISTPFFANKKLNIYLQLFHGYGESLIDYDHVNTRIGIGVLTTNWL